LHKGKRARHERSECPDSDCVEDVEAVEAVEATLGDRVDLRLLLRFGGVIGSASLSSRMCGVLPSICPSFALERSSWARCAWLNVL